MYKNHRNTTYHHYFLLLHIKKKPGELTQF